MGVLSGANDWLQQQFEGQGQALGQAFTSGGGAQGATSAGMGLGAAGMDLSMFGTAAKGVGQFEQYKYAAEVAHQNADAASRAGLLDASLVRTKYGEIANRQAAGYGAQGVGLTSPSASRTIAGTESTGNLAAAMTQYEANRRVWGYLSQAAADKAAAKMSLVGAGLNLAQDFIGGASGLSGKWTQYMLNQGQG